MACRWRSAQRATPSAETGGSVKKNPLRDRVFVPAESRGTARPSGAASPFAPDSCAWAIPKTPLTCLLAGCRLHGCTVLACTFSLQGLAWVKSLKRRTAVGCSLLPFLCWGSQRRRDGGGCPACCGAPADIPGLKARHRKRCRHCCTPPQRQPLLRPLPAPQLGFPTQLGGSALYCTVVSRERA